VIKENLEASDSVIKNDIAIFRIVLPTEICLHQQPTAFIHHQAQICSQYISPKQTQRNNSALNPL
jgi:hypothetical protein